MKSSLSSALRCAPGWPRSPRKGAVQGAKAPQLRLTGKFSAFDTAAWSASSSQAFMTQFPSFSPLSSLFSDCSFATFSLTARVIAPLPRMHSCISIPSSASQGFLLLHILKLTSDTFFLFLPLFKDLPTHFSWPPCFPSSSYTQAPSESCHPAPYNTAINVPFHQVAYHSSGPEWSTVCQGCGRHKSYTLWKDSPRMEMNKWLTSSDRQVPICRLLSHAALFSCNIYGYS